MNQKHSGQNTSDQQTKASVQTTDAGNAEVGKKQLPCFAVASTLNEVISAWSLVHDAYSRIGLIDVNKYNLHTITQAVSPETSVIMGYMNGSPVSTLSIIHDGAQQIPLQHIYPHELDALRNDGRKLLEVGLLADRREHISRAMVAIFEMMRFVFWRSYLTHTDIIIGVHPHHAGFYINSFGFEPIGLESTHPTVKNHPVLPMRLDIHTALAGEVVPKRLTQYLNNPLPDDVFDHRCRFDPLELECSPLGMYLANKARLAAQIRNAC